jgi:hypothetical protein
MTAPGRQAEPEPRLYVTEISWPEPDNGIQRLYSPMKAEPEPELEAG